MVSQKSPYRYIAKIHHNEVPQKICLLYMANPKYFDQANIKCRFLVEISLAYCNISDSILESIKRCKFRFIKIVNFNFNKITEKGAKIIT